MKKTQVIHLAPLHGITNYIFRNTYFKYFKGFSSAIAPFIISKNNIEPDNKLLKDILPKNNSHSIPIIPQILSNNPDEYVHLANLFKNMGYNEINWNLGCPYPMVANKKRGSGLLQHPDQIDFFLEKACAVQEVDLSLKIRLGRENSDEIDVLIPIFNRYPLKKIIIHPRTGIQMYEGHVDLSGFENAASHLRHTIVYNGDIFCKETFEELRTRFPVIREWMIGRGALRNPFLAEIISEKDFPVCENSQIRAFHDELFENYAKEFSGHIHVLDKMKELWTHMGQFFESGSKNIKKIHKAKSVNEYTAAVNILFS